MNNWPEFTVTMTVNFHTKAPDEETALAGARVALPSSFDLIDEEIKPSAEQDDETA